MNETPQYPQNTPPQQAQQGTPPQESEQAEQFSSQPDTSKSSASSQASMPSIRDISPEEKIQRYFKKDLTRYVLSDKYAFNCFDGQKENEKALLYIRKHWIIQFIVLSQAFFWMFLPIAGLIALLAYMPGLWDSAFAKIGIALVQLSVLFIALNWLVKWLDHFLDVIIVTNKRIVDINQVRIFNRKISSMSLGQIQDVSGQIKGFIPSMLNYGYLNIETAGQGELKQLLKTAIDRNGRDSSNGTTIRSGGVFELRYVYRASHVATAILNIRDYYQKRASLEEQGMH